MLDQVQQCYSVFLSFHSFWVKFSYWLYCFIAIGTLSTVFSLAYPFYLHGHNQHRKTFAQQRLVRLRFTGDVLLSMTHSKILTNMHYRWWTWKSLIEESCLQLDYTTPCVNGFFFFLGKRVNVVVLAQRHGSINSQFPLLKILWSYVTN